MELIHQNPGQNKQKKQSNGSINIIEQKKNLISYCKKTYIFQPEQMVYWVIDLNLNLFPTNYLILIEIISYYLNHVLI